VLELGPITLRLHLYRAIVAVANVALQSKTAGLGFGEETKTNALDIAEDLGLQPAPGIGIQSCARGAAVTTTETRLGASGIASRVRRTTGKYACTSCRADCSVGAPMTSRWPSQWQQVAVPSHK